MPQINNFPGGFAAGLTVRGMPIAITHPGKVFWVYNGTALSDRQINGSDGNQGTFDKPLATLSKAISLCVANRGDIIMVKPGHAETVTAAAGIVLSKAGVAIIGLGVGNARPTITFTTANTATITVTASQVSVTGFRFVANYANIATCFSIANAQVAKDFSVERCQFADTDATHNWLVYVTIGTTANIADGFTFKENVGVFKVAAGVTVAVKTGSIIDRMIIDGNYVSGVGTADQPLLAALGTVAHTDVQIMRNKVVNPATSSTNGLAVNATGTCTGLCYDNYIYMLDNSAGIWINVSSGLGFVNNYAMVTGAVDKSALINPVAV